MNPPESERLADHSITPETIAQYDSRIPRYTSYPTVPFWSHQFGPTQFGHHIETHSHQSEKPLSLYVHIPFCGKRCLFCACNVIVTRKDDVAEAYLDVLEREILLARSHYKGTGRVIQLHLGGGTPNFLDQRQMDRLLAILESAFDFSPSAERSIEIDPRVATPESIHALYHHHRYNRISFGVQDLHDETQFAIGREQARDITFRNVEAARKAGFSSVNIDLIYGLPQQTAQSWEETLQGILQLRPDRIALYNFAYLPERLSHHKFLDPATLPERDLKVSMFMRAHDCLVSNGWNFIGMDHYALHTDSLSKALSTQTLRRNFMGYTTLKGTNLLGFGVSAISDFEGAFAQNVKKLTTHRSLIGEGLLPVEQGMVLSSDDLLRRHCVESVMCNGVLSFNTPELQVILQESLPALQQLEAEGLLRMQNATLFVTLKGRVFLRNIAVVFDAYLKNKPTNRPMFSRSV